VLFLHVRGHGQAALPLLLTHGWPGNFLELLPLVPLLTDPSTNGGDADDAFDLVIPSLPGYGLSDPLPGRGASALIPGLWVRLMTEVLGYPTFAAHGGDIGAYVTNRLGVEARPGARHPRDHGRRAVRRRRGRATVRRRTGLPARAGRGQGGRRRLQPHPAHPPADAAYGLADSPAGLAAWILDKWWAWSDCGGDLERRFTKDELLTTVTLYWATQTIGSSLRVYRDWALGLEDRPETWRAHRPDWAPAGVEPRPLDPGEQIRAPAAVALFDYEAPRDWVERAYADLRRFAQMPRGGHFVAMEEPELLAGDLRGFFRQLR
jgi:pimeloyl-ACP methyl ester carboxylesterase